MITIEDMKWALITIEKGKTKGGAMKTKIPERVTFWCCIYCEADNVTESSIIANGDTFCCASCESQYSTQTKPA